MLPHTMTSSNAHILLRGVALAVGVVVVVVMKIRSEAPI